MIVTKANIIHQKKEMVADVIVMNLQMQVQQVQQIQQVQNQVHHVLQVHNVQQKPRVIVLPHYMNISYRFIMRKDHI